MSNELASVVTGENQLFAKLIVPTQSDGASFVQLGTDNVSAGKIETENREVYVTRLRVHEDHLEMGVAIQDKISRPPQMKAREGDPPDRTIRIPMEDITDVRQEQVEGYPGLAFETVSDLYRVKIASYTEHPLIPPPLMIEKEFDPTPISRAVSAIQNNMGGPSL